MKSAIQIVKRVCTYRMTIKIQIFFFIKIATYSKNKMLCAISRTELPLSH